MADNEKAILKAGYNCNNNCLICHASGNRFHKSLNTKEIINKISLCRKKGINFVLLSGGEPTIRKDLPVIAEFIKKKGMSWGLITNARMLSYEDYAKKLIGLNLRYVYASFYSSDKKVHNTLTGANSFEQSLKGIKNAASNKKIELIVNIPVTRINTNNLKETVDMLRKIGVTKIKFSFIEFKGNALKNIDRLILPVSKAAENVRDAMLYAEKKGFEVLCSGFPPCIIQGFESNIDDFEKQGITCMSEAFEQGIFQVDNDDKTKTEKCANCEKKELCPGIDKDYINLYGDSELKPIGKVSNSAFFAYEKTAKNIICKKEKIAQNKIAVKQDDCYEIFCYNSNDFSMKDIKRIKGKGQLYLAKDKNKHLLQKILKLSESDKCKKCKEKDACGRKYEARKEDNSALFQAKLEKELKKIRGKTLDIGFGRLHFYPILKKLAAERKILYSGIDPLKASVKGRNMRFTQKKFEETKFKADFFDVVLMLGSYNHIQDAFWALKEIHRILKKGGTLIICDDEAMIIAGRKGTGKKAEFEHYRNSSAAEAEKNLVRIGFKIKKKIGVSKKTGNIWLIRCAK